VRRCLSGSAVARVCILPRPPLPLWHNTRRYGSYLTIGPPLATGFYYDSFMGEGSITEKDFSDLDAAFQQCVKEKQVFERLIVTKEEALELFA